MTQPTPHDRKVRRKAFRLRIQRKSKAVVAKELGIAERTIDRWENGWSTRRGVRRGGWKEKLREAWAQLDEKDTEYGLLVKKVRLETYEELAAMVRQKIKKCFPSITAKSVSDIRGLLSELRELLKLLAQEKGELAATGPRTVVAVRTDVNMESLRERYDRAREIEARVVGAGSRETTGD